ncbi:DUF2254 domain-containing protein [Arenicella xantha]|uniref:Putative membrane protein n=1 Tax=Arenicella xantha TaxID=644221 RepID=A0A395JG17_9GAMM|nr:DUF2254 domain-containing protein [Arenicella xantha]RBP48722.1 putative membrane protein [Arenicella xantha]
MKLWLFQVMFNIRHSYWFIPSAMAIAAIALAVIMVAADIYFLPDIPSGYEWLFSSQPDGARAILSTVAGSTITVAGVVFSMTIMSVSHATANYGSRLLLRFLDDRRNQFSLGTFTATFIYCLLVLRTVSNADSGADGTDFVPHLAIFVALGLSLMSVAVLIAFIHHVPDTIHIGGITADRGRALSERLDTTFPAEPSDSVDIAFDDASSHTVASENSGYMQALDIDGLVKFARQRDITLQVLKMPGQFITHNAPVFKVAGSLDDFSDCANEMRQYFSLGRQRTPSQDILFLIEELVQIAARALSPGINDPFTANTCMDWLGNGVATVANRPRRAGVVRDSDDAARVFLTAFDFDDLCDAVFSSLRSYTSQDYNASMHMASVFELILSTTIPGANRNAVQRHAEHYLEDSLTACRSTVDAAKLKSAYTALLETH